METMLILTNKSIELKHYLMLSYFSDNLCVYRTLYIFFQEILFFEEIKSIFKRFSIFQQSDKIKN